MESNAVSAEHSNSHAALCSAAALLSGRTWEDCLALMQWVFLSLLLAKESCFQSGKAFLSLRMCCARGLLRLGVSKRMLCTLLSSISKPKYLPC